MLMMLQQHQQQHQQQAQEQPQEAHYDPWRTKDKKKQRPCGNHVLLLLLRRRRRPCSRVVCLFTTVTLLFGLLLLFSLIDATTSSTTTTVTRTPWLTTLRGGSSAAGNKINNNKKYYEILAVQIIHRHGDRTPITPLKDEAYWASTCISQDVLTRIAHGTRIIRKEDHAPPAHAAQGRGPFGQLTQLGLLQMIQVGTTLREELLAKGFSLQPKDIQVLSTDFTRTITSVQGLLVGLFPDNTPPGGTIIDIDVRHTNWLLPDPQPRHTQEQADLEMALAKRPEMVQRHAEMKPLAVKCTQALKPLLGDGAFDMVFGVGEEKTLEVLPWSQLAEITKCLAVRQLLPASITREDQEALSDFLAWKWLSSLRHERLIYLAMHHFCHALLHNFFHHTRDDKKLYIYSAHDSTLMGLLCAFRLQQPAVWPEYASVLKLELLQVSDTPHHHDDDKNKNDKNKHLVVRFYLNGQLLSSTWDDDKILEEIPLDVLAHYISTVGATSPTTANATTTTTT